MVRLAKGGGEDRIMRALLLLFFRLDQATVGGWLGLGSRVDRLGQPNGLAYLFRAINLLGAICLFLLSLTRSVALTKTHSTECSFFVGSV